MILREGLSLHGEDDSVSAAAGIDLIEKVDCLRKSVCLYDSGLSAHQIE